jgi:hypothetical protein
VAEQEQGAPGSRATEISCISYELQVACQRTRVQCTQKTRAEISFISCKLQASGMPTHTCTCAAKEAHRGGGGESADPIFFGESPLILDTYPVSGGAKTGLPDCGPPGPIGNMLHSSS